MSTQGWIWVLLALALTIAVVILAVINTWIIG